MATPEPVPQAITLAADRRSLLIDWGEGKAERATAAALREACRSSRSVRTRINGWAVPAPADLTIVDVRPVGRYAITLVFSDGHDRGIYPWRYLKEISRQGN
jgi:DUF971 family protein